MYATASHKRLPQDKLGITSIASPLSSSYPVVNSFSYPSIPNELIQQSHHHVHPKWLHRARSGATINRKHQSNLPPPRIQRPARLKPHLRHHELRHPGVAALGPRRRGRPAAAESGLRPRPQHLGYRECVQQRRERGDHRESDPEV
jgi:hypothetical protein